MFKIKSMTAQTHDSSMDSIIYKREKEEETKDNQMNETKQELEAKIREQLRLKEESSAAKRSIETLMFDHELYLLYTSYGKLVYEENN